MTTPRRKAPRKAASPRRKAETKTGPKEEPQLPPPEVFEPKPKPKHPLYGDKRIYSYTPKAGGPPIEFPHITEVELNPKFFWRIYPMNEMYQSFEWMNQAAVPRYVQERVIDLSPEEKSAFFKGWFKDIVAPQEVTLPGES